MFEPVHGSAPDIAGQGIANPIGAVWAAALLEDLGQRKAADALMDAVVTVLEACEVRTPDIGGSSTTEEMREALLQALRTRPAPALGSGLGGERAG